MEIELKVRTKRLKPPKWKWWQYLLLIAGIVLIIKGDYHTLTALFNLMKP